MGFPFKLIPQECLQPKASQQQATNTAIALDSDIFMMYNTAFYYPPVLLHWFIMDVFLCVPFWTRLMQIPTWYLKSLPLQSNGKCLLKSLYHRNSTFQPESGARQSCYPRIKLIIKKKQFYDEAFNELAFYICIESHPTIGAMTWLFTWMCL